MRERVVFASLVSARVVVVVVVVAEREREREGEKEIARKTSHTKGEGASFQSKTQMSHRIFNKESARTFLLGTASMTVPPAPPAR